MNKNSEVPRPVQVDEKTGVVKSALVSVYLGYVSFAFSR